MGCQQSKGVEVHSGNNHNNHNHNHNNTPIKTRQTNQNGTNTAPTSPALSTASLRSITLPREIQKISDPGRRLFTLLQMMLDKNKRDDLIWAKIVKICDRHSSAASFQHSETLDTPLHLACRVLTAFPYNEQHYSHDGNGNGNGDNTGTAITPLDAMRVLIRCSADVLPNRKGYIALHDILRIPPAQAQKQEGRAQKQNQKDLNNGNSTVSPAAIQHQTQVVNLLIAADYESSLEYLQRANVVHDPNDGAATPLYLATASIPDDFSSPGGPTVQFISAIHFPSPNMAAAKNKDNCDKPLALLYRRFSRQFDQSEKFFPGDNSTPEIIAYRQQYKTAAMNTWKIILCLLDPLVEKKQKSVSDFYMVHAAVRMDCPPDLLRYIIETRPEEVRQTNERGRLPLHVAADAKSNSEPVTGSGHEGDGDGGGGGDGSTASKYHYKFVMDELLYSYPDGAASTDADNMLPLQLAVESGKSWIGGGTKSLHDVYPDAMNRVSMEDFPSIKTALSFSTNFAEEQGEELKSKTNVSTKVNTAIEKEEHYDAIMMVQKPDANLGDVISAMWANEEDAGVQMLGCVAISNMAHKSASQDANYNTRNGSGSGSGSNSAPKLRAMALTAVTTVVNAMKNHPNEPIVQEKACGALRLLAPADHYREVSFAASGAAASIVNAMQAHVSDAIVQKEACMALRQIIIHGGAERATVVASVSGFTALQNALGTHSDQGQVQKEACLALEALTSFPDANLPLPGGVQVAPLLEAAKERHAEDCKEVVDIILSRLP